MILFFLVNHNHIVLVNHKNLPKKSSQALRCADLAKSLAKAVGASRVARPWVFGSENDGLWNI